MSIINYLIPTVAADIVGIFDEQFNQLFSTARPMKATVKLTSKTMDHPIETGSIRTDHKILNPIEIELPLIVSSFDYRDVYAAIREAYKRSSLLTILTNVTSYNNMIIDAMPHEEAPDMMDSISIALSLKEVFLVSSTTKYAPKDKTKVTTQKLGEQKPQAPKGSYLYRGGKSLADQVQSAISGGK